MPENEPLIPELADPQLHEYGAFAEDTMARAKTVAKFEQRMDALRKNGYGVIVALLLAIAVLAAIIWWQKQSLDDINRKIGFSQNTLVGVRDHTFGARFIVSDRGRFIAFPVGTTLDTNWSCASWDSEKAPCVQVSAAR